MGQAACLLEIACTETEAAGHGDAGDAARASSSRRTCRNPMMPQAHTCRAAPVRPGGLSLGKIKLQLHAAT